VSDFSIDMLAAAMKVSRRTIERCIVDGSLVPAPGFVAAGAEMVVNTTIDVTRSAQRAEQNSQRALKPHAG
jgi:hypothetical protein